MSPSEPTQSSATGSRRRLMLLRAGVIALAFALGALTIALIRPGPADGADPSPLPVTTTVATRPPPPSTVPESAPPQSTDVSSPAPSSSTTQLPPVASGSPAAGEQQFLATFETAEDLDLFDFEVRHGAPNDPSLTPSWQGDHDHSCGSPSTSRTVNQEPSDVPPGPVANVGDLVWHCAPSGPESGHIMTSLHTTGYGHLDFSPRQTFTDVERVCWDQNFTEMGRKWTQVSVIPEAQLQANGGSLAYAMISLQEEVAAAVERTEGDAWLISNGAGGSEVQIGQTMVYQDFDTGGLLGSQDKARRYHNCAIDLGDGTVRLELERSSGTIIRDTPGSFPDGEVRVIFQDVTYDAPKGPPFEQTISQNTWHWDNIEIS